MKLFNIAAVALAFGLGGAAQASTITLETFTTAGWQSAAQGGIFEDFENATAANRRFASDLARIDPVTNDVYGELNADGYNSRVGNFTTLGGVGTGTTCTDLLDTDGGGCSQIALQYDPGINGQGNAFPETGEWSLNSADTRGMLWSAEREDGGMFQRLVFALTDPADTGAKSLDISVDGTSKSWTTLANGATWLAVINLDAPTNAVDVVIRTSLRDGFTLDGAALAPVPLPASVLFLLGGLGMMAAFRRRNAQTA